MTASTSKSRPRKKKSRRSDPASCRGCHDPRLDGELFFHGLCDRCRALKSQLRRKETAERLLAKAKPAGTVLRDGREFTVVTLPPKRRGGTGKGGHRKS